MSIRTRARRAAALLAGGALVASGLALSGPAPVARAAEGDAPTAAAANWLEAQLNDAHIFGTDVSSVTATIDFGIGLARSGADATLLTDVIAGIDGVVSEYIGTEGDTAKSGRVAKAAVFYALAANPKDVGAEHLDLITRLEGDVEPSGRLIPSFGDADYFGQASAVLALDLAASSEAGPATDFLIAGQCDSGAAAGGWGYFDTFSDPVACVPDVDTTSLAIAALAGQVDPDAQDAVSRGVTWLLTQQAANGSLGKNDYLPYNANSTGLAAWALSEAGADGAAAKAATWLRAHQLTGLFCDRSLVAEAGMIAYSDEALSSDLSAGLGNRNEAISATAQAFPSLAFVPAPTSALAIKAPAFVKAGTPVTLTSTGLAAGERGCASIAGKSVTVVGVSQPRSAVAMPKGTKAYTAALRTADGALVTTRVVALAPKTLPVARRSFLVRRGGYQVVRVTGLVRGEYVAVRYGTRLIATGKASSLGTFNVRFNVGRAKGLKTVAVRGQFDTRRGSLTFRVR